MAVKLPFLGDVYSQLQPRTTPDGTVVTYVADPAPCGVCALPCWVRVTGRPIHSDGCLDRAGGS